MDSFETELRPLIDLLPQAARPYWCAVAAGVGVVALVLVLLVLRGLWRLLFGRRRAQQPDWYASLRENLNQIPLPAHTWGERVATVYHLPVRLRLVVVAPAGTESFVDATAVERLLDQVVPGLGAVCRHDEPRIRVWPAQLSQRGFAATFFRTTLTGDREGEPSRWVLLAGKTQAARNPTLLGLALWSAEPNTIGRLTVEGYQWLDVVRIKEREG